MKFKLKNILPNPFRHIEHYPIQKEKVLTLGESIQATGFWDNIVARQRNGNAEIAYGHHRLETLRGLFGPSHEVDLIIRDLDDAMMLQIMARENQEEWGTSAWVELETIKAVVEAFGAGRITLQKTKGSLGARGSSVLRQAPSFIRGQFESGCDSNLYTAETVAEFIGWLQPNGEPQKKVITALSALELIEKKVLKEAQFYKLSSFEASSLVSETQQTLRWRERSPLPQHKATAITKAREVGTAIAKSFQADKQTGGNAKERAKKERIKIDHARPKQMPDINKFVSDLNHDMSKILSARDPMTQKIREVIECIDSLGKTYRADLQYGLEMVAHRAISLAKLVKSGKVITPRETQRLLMNS